MKNYAYIFIIVLCALMGAINAGMDTLAHHFSGSIFESNPEFWDANQSWCNKWENCIPGKEAFLGSSTVFSFLTDGWHLLKFFYLFLISVPITLLGIHYIKDDLSDVRWKRWLAYLGVFAVVKIVQAGSFTLFYNYILWGSSN